MVTVDGPKNIHDQRRIMTGGQGTFDQIQKVFVIHLIMVFVPL